MNRLFVFFPLNEGRILKVYKGTVVTEITLCCKKYFLLPFSGLQSKAVKSLICFKKASKTLIIIRDLRPHFVILTGEFSCQSNQWWSGDKKLPEGIALDDLLESYNMTQLIDQPTSIESRGISCIDLTVI